MSVRLDAAVPILRIFDVDRALGFYVEWLGCTLDWEHRFDPDAPLYLQVSRGDLVLHLSEHSGDGTPGTAVYIRAAGVADLHAELATRPYRYLRPGLGVGPTGGACLDLLDPFGNTLRIEEAGPATPLPKTSNPAAAALAAAGIASLEDLAARTRREVADLHGMGPKALGILDAALADHGLAFRG